MKFHNKPRTKSTYFICYLSAVALEEKMGKFIVRSVTWSFENVLHFSRMTQEEIQILPSSMSFYNKTISLLEAVIAVLTAE